jgi:hypothetical protein
LLEERRENFGEDVVVALADADSPIICRITSTPATSDSTSAARSAACSPPRAAGNVRW